jgi:hypothetical protein
MKSRKKNLDKRRKMEEEKSRMKFRMKNEI